MISVNFGTFSKRKNSTKQPDLTTFTEISCALKDGCSEDQPVFVLSLESFPYTYAEWAGRYYWITNVEYTRNNLFTVSCKIDVLATYKTDIMDTTAFVMYRYFSSSDIPDTRFPLLATPTIRSNSVVFRDDVARSGSYILSCVGQNGSVQPFRVARSSINTILNNIDTWYQTNIWQDMDDASGESVVMALLDGFNSFVRWCNNAGKVIVRFFTAGNALDAVRALTWIPFDVPEENGQTIYLGDYDTQVTGFPVSNTPALQSVTVDIPWQYTDWRNSSRCTQVYLYLPYVGVISYNADNLKGITSITVQSSLQRTTGDITFYVSAGDEILGTYGANTGAAVPIGSSNITMNQITNGITSAAAGISAISSGNPLGFAALMNTGKDIIPNATCIGGLGNSSAVQLSVNATCFTVCHNTSVGSVNATARRLFGTPFFNISTVRAAVTSDYIQTMNFSFPGSCLDNEREEINAFLDGGIYVE